MEQNFRIQDGTVLKNFRVSETSAELQLQFSFETSKFSYIFIVIVHLRSKRCTALHINKTNQRKENKTVHLMIYLIQNGCRVPGKEGLYTLIHHRIHVSRKKH